MSTTQVWRLGSEWRQTDNLDELLAPAASLLANGSLISFPTETVYGLGADALNDSAVSAIFDAKGRPSDNPLIVHIARTDQLASLVTHIPDSARKLMNAFWPGPLTIVLKHDCKRLSKLVTAGLDTVAVRMPDHGVALTLIRLANVPVAAPSANTSGKPSPTCASHVLHDLGGRIAGLVDGGATGIGVESTVVDCSGSDESRVTILRPGGVTKEQLEKVIDCVAVDPSLMRMERRKGYERPVALSTPVSSSPLSSSASLATSSSTYNAGSSNDACRKSTEGVEVDEKRAFDMLAHRRGLLEGDNGDRGGGAMGVYSCAPKAPGMKYTHYAPRAIVRVIQGSVAFWKRVLTDHLHVRDDGSLPVVGAMMTRELRAELAPMLTDTDGRSRLLIKECGTRANLAEVAQRLFSVLRAFDDTAADMIFAEHLPSDGIGLAVMNRLLKAAGRHVLVECTADD